jgi:hypothetical protein
LRTSSSATRCRRKWQFIRAYDNGQQAGNDVVWNLGKLEPNGRRQLRVEVEGREVTRKTTNNVVATFGPNLVERSERDIELRGIPALLMMAEQSDRKGTINVGDVTSYTVTINNTGSQNVGRIVLRAKTSQELKYHQSRWPRWQSLDKSRVIRSSSMS